MPLTKLQEKRLRTSVKLITVILKSMTGDTSADFVLEQADPLTLRALRELRSELNDWGLRRTGLED